MVEENEDIGDVVGQYGFIELPAVDEHRNFILELLRDRYVENRDKDMYITIVHRHGNEHYIMGIYDSLREALQTRFVANSLLHGGSSFSPDNFMMVHHISGPTIEDKVFDPKTNTVKDFEAPQDD